MKLRQTALASILGFVLVTVAFPSAIPEDPVGDWLVLGVEAIKMKGGGERTAFQDTFTFYDNGTCRTIEGLVGDWHHEKTKLLMEVDPQDVLDLMNQYFDDLGYGGVIVADDLDGFRQICTIRKGVLKGSMKSRLTISVPSQGLYGLKLSWTAKWVGVRD
jgi:hypothetical protein